MNRHMYKFEDMLNPERKPLSQSSTGKLLHEKLLGILNSWTDPNYADRRPPQEVLQQLKHALMRECTHALAELEKDVRVIELRNGEPLHLNCFKCGDPTLEGHIVNGMCPDCNQEAQK